jgi:type IV pilus assembly protein PilE
VEPADNLGVNYVRSIGRFMRNIRLVRGFTLIEMLVVVCILGILASIAYPSYMRSVQKSNRSEAKTELNDAAQRFQRCYTLNGRYDVGTNCPIFTQLDGGGSYPTKVKAFYSISASAITSTGFRVVATAIKAPQLKDTKDSCNVLSLDQNGVRTPTACW